MVSTCLSSQVWILNSTKDEATNQLIILILSVPKEHDTADHAHVLPIPVLLNTVFAILDPKKNRRRCLNNHLNKTIIPQEIPPNVQPAFHCQPAIPLVGPMAAFTIVATQAIINSWTFSLTFSKPAEKTRGNGDH